MPFIYAIRTPIYDGLPPVEGEWKPPVRYDYPLVPETVAELDSQGVYKLVSKTGDDVTDWMSIFSEYRAHDNTKVGAGKPLKDALGTELAGGDYVMVSDTKTSKLEIQEVVGFTPKKIRVRNVGGWGEGSTKEPIGIVKVDKSLFF